MTIYSINLQTKIQLLIILLFIVVLGILGIIFIKFIDEPYKNTVKSNLERLTERTTSQIRQLINRGYGDIEVLSKNPTIRSVDASKLEKLEILNLVQEKYGIYDDITLINPDGFVVVSTTYSFAGEWLGNEGFLRAREGEVVMSDARIILSPYRVVLNFFAPLIDHSNKTIAVVATQMPMNEIWKITDGLKVGESGFIYMLNDVNQFISHPDKKLIISSRADHSITKGMGGKSGFISYTDGEGLERIGYYSLLEDERGMDWKVVLTQRENEAFFFSRLLYQNIIFASITGLVLTFIISIPFVRFFIISRIKIVLKGMKRVAKGDLDSRVKIKSQDELGELASGFNLMVNELKESNKKVENYTEELKAKIQELTETKTAILNMMEDLDQSNVELLKTQRKIKKSYKELKKLDLEKDRFISIAAHELKTPMTAIHGFAQLLKNVNIITDVKTHNKYLEIIEKETERLTRLVTEVLDLSRADIGTLRLTIEAVNVIKLAEEVKDQMNQKAKKGGLDLSFKIDHNLPHIKTDEEKLKGILINLVDNAIKYTKKGGIRVEVIKKDDHVKFSVADTGIGIPKEHHKKMFTRFHQVASPLTRKVGGTGLGLSICKEFVEALGGKIGFKSKLGKGTTFYFTLPIKFKPPKKRLEKNE